MGAETGRNYLFNVLNLRYICIVFLFCFFCPERHSRKPDKGWKFTRNEPRRYLKALYRSWFRFKLRSIPGHRLGRLAFGVKNVARAASCLKWPVKTGARRRGRSTQLTLFHAWVNSGITAEDGRALTTRRSFPSPCRLHRRLPESELHCWPTEPGCM